MARLGGRAAAQPRFGLRRMDSSFSRQQQQRAVVKQKIGYLLFGICAFALGWTNYQMYPQEFSELMEIPVPGAGVSNVSASALQPGWIAAQTPRIQGEALTPSQMFADLSDMLPDYQGSCPDLPGYPAEWLHLRDLSLCKNLLKRASDRGECLIYNFGVGNRDPFLDFMGRTQEFKCEVFAFDPFVTKESIKTKLGENIHFHEIGLWNGESDRIVGPQRTGRLMSLDEIQAKLNHTAQTRVTFFRSDCEGCEYGWVKHAMDRDAKFFEQVDQMFIELHTVPIKFMSSISLTWKEGLPPTHLLEPVHTMMTKYFRVLRAAVNPGGPIDRNRVPESLHQQGVLKYPCCRELNLINEQLAAPPRSIENEELACEKSNPDPKTLEGFAGRFSDLFLGRQNKCNAGETPVCLQDLCYCPNMLAGDANVKLCLVYFFGNFKDPDELNLLEQIATRHPTCSIWALDPRSTFEEVTWNNKNLTNVHFMSWGLYSGKGPRAVRNEQNGDAMPAPVGELYTMAEITLSWTRTNKVFETAKIANPKPSWVSLLRVDWSMAPPCSWQSELLEPSDSWWGSYKGAETLQQLA